MSPYPVEYQGKSWKTTEALFQALRFDDEDVIEKIRSDNSPMGAKFTAKKYKSQMIVDPQSSVDIKNMIKVVALKIEQHPDLRELLVNTGTDEIIEDVTSRMRGSGVFWGAGLKDGDWIGENILGKIWMKQRSLLYL
jgi:ribA/ribD-fused uncharacterized protein